MNNGSNTQLDPLQELLYGNPTQDSFTFEAIMAALEEANEKTFSYGPLLSNPQVLGFVSNWHAGDNRHGTLGIPYMQHVLGIGCLAAKNDLPEEIVLAALLKSIAQNRPTRSKMEFTDYENLLAGLNNPVLNVLLDELAGLNTVLSGKKKKNNAARKEAKIGYLSGLSLAALVIEMLSKYENLIADIKDLRKCGNSHWDHFKTKVGDTIRYFKNCLEIFRSVTEKYPFAVKLLNDFEKQIESLRTLNKKPAKKLLAEEA